MVMHQRIQTPAERIAETASFICGLYGVDLGSVRGPSRKRDYLAARIAVARYLVEDLGWSTLRAGRYLRRDHTSVLYYLGRLKRKPVIACLHRGLTP